MVYLDRMTTSICVYCGSRPGRDGLYAEAARSLGAAIASKGCSLVYGGGGTGTMRDIAEAVLANGGAVTGVMPRFMVENEAALTTLADLRLVHTMHERKALMAELADAFVAMPGGFGTLEEWFEAVTSAQLKLHAKPCGLLNVNGYYDHLITFIDHAITEGFIKETYRDLIVVDSNPDRLLERLLPLAQ